MQSMVLNMRRSLMLSCMLVWGICAYALSFNTEHKAYSSPVLQMYSTSFGRCNNLCSSFLTSESKKAEILSCTQSDIKEQNTFWNTSIVVKTFSYSASSLLDRDDDMSIDYGTSSQRAQRKTKKKYVAEIVDPEDWTDPFFTETGQDDILDPDDWDNPYLQGAPIGDIPLCVLLFVCVIYCITIRFKDNETRI